jgi:enoyl-CoA hydratase
MEEKNVDYENLRYEVSEAIATITIDRPRVLNALNRATISEIRGALEKAGGDPIVRVIILTGAGDKAFIGGADVREMYDNLKTSGPGGLLADFRSTVIDPLLSLGKPIIAAVNGYCLGGGLEIVYACTLAYAAKGARFGQPEVNLGFNPMAGATQQLPLLAGKKRALEILLQGEMFDADEAMRLGIINGVVPKGELLPKVREVAVSLAAKAPLAVKSIIQCVRQAGYLTLEQGLELEAKCYALCCAGQDVPRRLEAFLGKTKVGSVKE